MANFFDTVISVLKQDERFFSAEGELLRNAVYEAAMKMDSALLKLLYNNEVTTKLQENASSRILRVFLFLIRSDSDGSSITVNSSQILIHAIRIKSVW